MKFQAQDNQGKMHEIEIVNLLKAKPDGTQGSPDQLQLLANLLVQNDFATEMAFQKAYNKVLYCWDAINVLKDLHAVTIGKGLAGMPMRQGDIRRALLVIPELQAHGFGHVADAISRIVQTIEMIDGGVADKLYLALYHARKLDPDAFLQFARPTGGPLPSDNEDEAASVVVPENTDEEPF